MKGETRVGKYQMGQRSKLTLDSIGKYFPVNGTCVFRRGSWHFHGAALPLLEGKRFLCVFRLLPSPTLFPLKLLLFPVELTMLLDL